MNWRTTWAEGCAIWRECVAVLCGVHVWYSRFVCVRLWWNWKLENLKITNITPISKSQNIDCSETLFSHKKLSTLPVDTHPGNSPSILQSSNNWTFRFSPVRVLWPRSRRIVLFSQFCALEWCSRLTLVRYAVKPCTWVLWAENIPHRGLIWGSKRDIHKYEWNLAQHVFGNTGENIRRTTRLSH